MGRESVDPPPSPSPLDQSTNSFNQGPFFPTTFTTSSKKKWIALGLTAFLIIVLLIAVIILAVHQTPSCPTQNVSGSPDALEGHEGPKLEESRQEGVPTEPPELSMTSTSTTTSTTTTELAFDFGNDFDDEDEFNEGDEFFDIVNSMDVEQDEDSSWTGDEPYVDTNEILKGDDVFQPDLFYPEANSTEELDDGLKNPTPEDIAEMLALIEDPEEARRFVEKYNR